MRRLFGHRLRELRRHAAMSRADLGELVGRGEKVIGAIETGRSSTSVVVAARIAAALEVPLSELCDLGDQPSPDPEKRRMLRDLNRTIRHDDRATLRLIADVAKTIHDNRHGPAVDGRS